MKVAILAGGVGWWQVDAGLEHAHTLGGLEALGRAVADLLPLARVAGEGEAPGRLAVWSLDATFTVSPSGSGPTIINFVTRRGEQGEPVGEGAAWYEDGQAKSPTSAGAVYA